MNQLNPKLNLNKSSRMHSQLGATLVEIMVGVAIMAIVSLAMTTMLSNSNKAVQSINATGDFNSLVNTIQGVLNNSSSCVATFGGASITALNAVINSTTNRQAVSLSVGGVSIGANYKVTPTLTVRSLDFIGKAAGGGVNQWVVDMQLTGDRTVGNQAAVGGKTILKTFRVVVTVDAPATRMIIACSGLYTDFWTEVTGQPGDITYMGGRVGIGVALPATTVNLDVGPNDLANPTALRVNVYGTVQAASYIYNSDRRLKENIREIPNALERVLKLHGVIYNWKNKGLAKATDNLGLLAQEVEEVFPEVVVTNPETGLKSVAYGNLIAPLFEALKSQQEIINQQQQEIKEIKEILLKNKFN